MRFAFTALILLALASSIIASDCITCEEMAGKPQARILTINDDTAHTLDIYVYYENLSAPISRQPINNSIILVEMTNSTGLKELYKTYTDSNGSAHFDFTSRKDGCITFKVLYCPFCNPSSPECGFKACLNYSLIDSDKNSADEIDVGPGSKPAPDTLNPERYLPAVDQLSYCPPPPSMEGTPGLCLPLLIIFSMLSGALYLTGKNPWAGFNIGGARVGKHFRYQARGRGFSLDIKSAIMSISSAAGEMKEVEVGKTKDGKSITKRQGELSKPKWFLYSNIREVGRVIGGSEGSGGRGTQTDKDRTTAGGERSYVGLKKAFDGATLKGQWTDAQIRGRGERGADGSRAGFFGALGNMAREFGIALGRIAVAFYSATWIGQLGGNGDKLAGKLEKSIANTDREQHLRVASQREQFEDTAGVNARDLGMQLRTGHLPPGVTQGTDDRGAFLSMNVGEGADRREVKVRDIQINAADGTWSARLETTSTDGRQLTSFRMENGHVSSMDVLTRSELGGGYSGQSYTVARDGTISASGLVSIGSDGARTVQEVHRDSGGRITAVGDIQITYGADGQITRMFDSHNNREVANTTEGFSSVSQLVINDGTKNTGNIVGFSQVMANAQDITHNVNGSYEHQREVYMEQFGQVRVTDNDVLREGKGTYNIEVLDATAAPPGESRDRGLSTGTKIAVADGAYVSATDASGHNILQRDQPVQGVDNSTWYQTSIAGSNVVLDTHSSSGTPVDASAVREHWDDTTRLAGGLVDAIQNYRVNMGAKAAEALMSANPTLAAAFGTAIGERSSTDATFAARMDGRPELTPEQREYARMLYGSVSLGQSDTDTASQVERGKHEADTAMTRWYTDGTYRTEQATAIVRAGMATGGPDPSSPEGRAQIERIAGGNLPNEALSPRAQLYYAATTVVHDMGMDPSSPQGRQQLERIMVGGVNPQSLSIDYALREARHDPALAARYNLDTPEGRQAFIISNDGAGLIRSGTEHYSNLGLTQSYTGVSGLWGQEHDSQVAGLQSTDPHAQAAARTAFAQGQSADSGAVGTLIGDRVHDRVDDVMRDHPEILVGVGADREVQFAARTVLGIGTDLVGMSDADIRARVEPTIRTSIAAEVRADTSIPADRREAVISERVQQSMGNVDQMLPGARQMAGDFSAAERATTDTLRTEPRTFMPTNADQSWDALYHGGDQEERRQFVIDASRTFGDLSRSSYLEQSDYENEYNRRLGGFLAQHPEYHDNLGITPEQSFLFTTAGGGGMRDPNLDGLNALAGRSEPTNLLDSNYHPNTVGVNTAALQANFEATRAPTLLALDNVSGTLPHELYDTTNQGIAQYNRARELENQARDITDTDTRRVALQAEAEADARARAYMQESSQLAVVISDNPRLSGYEQSRATGPVDPTTHEPVVHASPEIAAITGQHDALVNQGYREQRDLIRTNTGIDIGDRPPPVSTASTTPPAGPPSPPSEDG